MRRLERSNPMSNVVWISSSRGSAARPPRAGAASVAETLFELRVERLFAEAPSLADAEAFAERTLERISRGWLARRAVIGSMGVLGGLIGGFEVVSTGALGQFGGLVAQAPG